MNFKLTVQAMSAKEIILTMIKGLEHPKVKVDMSTFGIVRKAPGILGFFGKKICFGCAATNMVCTIIKRPYTVKEMKSSEAKMLILNTGSDFIQGFESAIDELRKGRVSQYNYMGSQHGMPFIPETALSVDLPVLTNEYTVADLKKYINFAYSLDKIK